MLAEDALEEATRYSRRHKNLLCTSSATPLLLLRFSAASPRISSASIFGHSVHLPCRCELEYRSLEASQFKELADRLQAAPATRPHPVGLIPDPTPTYYHPTPRHIAPKSGIQI